MAQQHNPQETDRYTEHYSEEGLWKKIQQVAKRAGVKVIYYVLLLYYALESPNTSSTDKAIIIGALGYFILPIDLVPDFLVGLGYTDDLGALAWALCRVLKNITPEVTMQAQNKLKEWFGEVDEEQLELPDSTNETDQE